MNNSKIRTPFYIKFIECLFAAIAVINIYNSLVLFPLTTLPGQSKNIWLFNLNSLLVVAGFLFVICYPIYWHRKESKNEIDTSLQHAWFRGMLRYWLSISICSYGFGKILGNQFAHSYFRDNSLVKNLSGYDLTWNYFGHSYSFAVIIAILQIGGSL